MMCFFSQLHRHTYAMLSNSASQLQQWHQHVCGRHEDHHCHSRLRLRLPGLDQSHYQVLQHPEVRSGQNDPALTPELLLPSTTSGSASRRWLQTPHSLLRLPPTHTRRSRALQQVGFNTTAQAGQPRPLCLRPL